MQQSATILITTTGALNIIVQPQKTKWYLSETVRVNIAWTPISGSSCVLTINWGDGTVETKTVQYPADHTHVYTVSGNYTINVTVKDNGTLAEGSGSTAIQVVGTLAITFTSDKTSGNIPLAVTFSCHAWAGFPNYSWTLDPGDGSTPYSGSNWNGATFTQAHTYNKVGSFTARLTVTDTLGGTMVSRLVTLIINPIETIKTWLGSLTTPQKALVAVATISTVATAIFLFKKR